MKTVLYAAPTEYPVSMLEIKDHLRIDSGTLEDTLTATQCMAYGSHAIANDYVTHVGTAVEVLGKEAVIVMNHGTNGATGTVDTIVQHSHDGTTWATYSTFAQVTTANDNANYSVAYSGGRRYVRTASKVLLAACVFGSSVIVKSATALDEDYIEECLKAAIDEAEDFTSRQIMTATWDLYLKEFPAVRYIELPYGNLQSVTHIKYTDSDGVETTLTATTDYLVETNGEDLGRIVLPKDVSWPLFSSYPSNPIVIRFICGYASAAVVPTKIKNAIKLLVHDYYTYRGNVSERALINSGAAKNLLYAKKLWGF